MKRIFTLIGFLIISQTGCNKTDNQNSNVVANNNSAITVNKSSAANTNNTPPVKHETWSTQPSAATAVIENFIAAAEKGDINAMEKNYSREFMKQKGPGLKSIDQGYSKLIRGFDPKDKPVIFDMGQKVQGDKVIVEFNYGIAKNGVPAGKSTGCTAFELVKEDNEWKINGSPGCE